jgi:radical SAM enzyme (TIGR01210 family)
MAHVRMLLRRIGAPLVNVAPSDPSGTDAFLDNLKPEELEHTLSQGHVPYRVEGLQSLVSALGDCLRPRVDAATAMEKGDILKTLLIGLMVENYLSDTPGLTIEKSLRRWLQHRASDLERLGFDVLQTRQLAVCLSSRNIRGALHLVASVVFRMSMQDLLELLEVSLTQRYPELRPEHVKQAQSPDRPLQFWVDHDCDGPLLFIVYYSGACTYKICFGCALPSLSSEAPVAPHLLIAQTDHVLDDLLLEQELSRFASVFLSNNGSMFDRPTFSATALHHVISRCLGEMPRLQRIVLETRAEFLDDAKLEAINELRAEHGSNVRIEIALGVEVFDETLRNKIAKKGLSRRGIERCIQLLGKHDMDLRCYFMLKPHPSMTDEQAYADILGALDMLDEMSERTGTRIVMHLNPTYAAVGTDLETAFLEGRYDPPRLEDLERFLQRHAGRRTRVHIGLNDEGLAVDGGSFLRAESTSSLRSLRRHNMVSASG